MSRWSTWSKGSEHKEKRGFASFMKEDPQRMGNPAANVGGPADRAAAFGLQSDGSGNYIDPKTGQKVATTVNNELVFIDNSRATGGAISDSSGGAALTQAAPSWVDPMTGMVTVPPAQPESPEEISAVPDATPATAPKGYDAFMNKKKDQAYAMGAGGPESFSQGTPEIGLDAQPGSINPIGGMGGPDLSPTMGENYNPEDLSKRDVNRPVTPQERVQKVRSAVQAQQQQQTPQPTPQKPPVDTNNDGRIDQEELRQSALNAYQDWQTPRITADMRMEKKFSPMMEALNHESVDPKLRDRLMHTMLNSMRYEGRNNEASSDLTKTEFQLLQENRDRIMRAYGGEGSDGSAHNFDAIRQYQSEINDPDLDEKLLKQAFDALPPSRQKIFKGGDMNAFQGFKKFISQRGKGGYTGMDLDMDTMQMEHFIDNSQSQRIKELIKKEGREMTPEEKELVDFIASEDNQFWSRQSPNEQKSSRNIRDFFEQRIDPLDELGEDFFDFRELKLDPARLDLKNQEKGYIQNMIDTDDDGNISLQEMDEAGFDAHLGAVNGIYDKQKNDLLEALTQRFDKKSLMKLGPKAFEKLIADEKSDVNESDRSRYEMLRNLQSKVKGYNSSFQKRIAQALGIPTGFIQSERARTNGASPEIYKSVIKSLVGKSKEEQKEQIEKIKAVFSQANSAANSIRGQGNTDAQIKQMMYQTLFNKGTESGLFDDSTFEGSPELTKLRDKFTIRESNDDMMEEPLEDMGYELEDIIELIKQLAGGKNFEQFRNQKP